MSEVLQEKRSERAAKATFINEVLELAADGNNRWDMSRKSVLEKLGATSREDAVEKLQAKQRELTALGLELEQAEIKMVSDVSRQASEKANRPADHMNHPSADDANTRKTLGQMFTSSKQYTDAYRKNRQVQVPFTAEIGLKTLMQTTAGFAPESVRSGLVVPAVNFSLAEIIDLVPIFSINQPSFVYMEETTRTHNAAETAEGIAYPESAFAYTQRTSNVQKIADSLPVTDEQLEDESQVASLIDQRLRYGVRRRLATQLLNGNGTPPNLRGVLNVVGIQTQAKGADSIMAAAYKAITKVRFTGQAEPNAFVFHPNDWQDVVLAQESTGAFLWGHPAAGPVTSLWGMRVALSTGIAENTALVGDWSNFSRLDEKRGVEIQIGYVNTQFTEGEKTLRADMRAAFTVTRPVAFCSITGV
jgi:HK97 family phage major capsid protein